MGLLILEALGALALLVFLVWWTMFHGRRRGERQDGSEKGREEGREEVRDDGRRGDRPPGAG